MVKGSKMSDFKSTENEYEVYRSNIEIGNQGDPECQKLTKNSIIKLPHSSFQRDCNRFN